MWQLGEWGEDKKTIEFDEKALTMTFSKKEVVCASIHSGKFQVDWLDQKRNEWKELEDSVELKALVEAASKKTEQASANASKGTGKCKRSK